MKLSAKSNYTPTPAGQHLVRCIQIIDLGLQQTMYGVKDQLLITWELVNELMDDGRPFVTSRRYTKTISDKSRLKQDLESWRGCTFTEQEREEFDPRTLLGKSAMLNILHETKDGKVYANIVSITPVPAGVDVPESSNPQLFFDQDEPDTTVLEALPEWLRKIISEAQKPSAPVTKPTLVADNLPQH